MLVVCNYLSPLFSQNYIFPLDISESSAYDELNHGFGRAFLSGNSGCSVWEVLTINKQKFLAELAKLLTFMYEEDRQKALGAYNEMFDEAEDEQMLLQALVSPLRQAVEVARAYNSGKQSLSAEAKPREGEPANDAFLDTIHRIRAEALSTQPVKQVVSEDQISLFDAPEEPEAEEASVPAEAEDEAEEPVPEDAEESASAEPEAAEEADEEDDEEEEEPDAPAAAERKTMPAPQSAEPSRLPVQKTVRKPRILLLILYILIAVPLALIGFVVLLIPALASLAAAIACIVVAVLAITSAIGSFPKIANLLVALGAALILLAVGLVFLMLFVWFLGGAIGGMINGIISLGGKWCYKEVPAA